MESIGSRIRKRREELKMSQDTLAQKVGYTSRTSIAKIESDDRELPQSKIFAIATALNTTTSYIMGWDDTESPVIISEGYSNTLQRLINAFSNKDLTEDEVDKIIDFGDYLILKRGADND